MRSPELTVDKVVFKFETSGNYVRGLCKFAVFGLLCSDLSYTISEDTWIASTHTFDLLQNTSLQIVLPTLTITPDPCYTTTWSILRTSDSVDMVADKSTVFSISDPNLTISDTVSNFADRLALYGTTVFHFKGSTSTSTPTISSNFALTIDFIDACRTSTIVGQTITLTAVKYD